MAVYGIGEVYHTALQTDESIEQHVFYPNDGNS
jgi:hypothetical protein